MLRRILLVLVVSVLAHILFGWVWSVFGAILGGWFALKRGWLIGGVGLSLAWALIVLYDLLSAPSQVAEMAHVVGSLLGNLPGFATYAATVLIGFVFGLLGGAVGYSAAALFRAPERSNS